jgi:hypothetical protein
MNDNIANWVTVILALGASIQPLFLGVMFMFMFKFFPTRKEVELQEQNQAARHAENTLRFGVIERDVKELLSRQ